MAKIKFSMAFVAQIIEDNLPWPKGTRLDIPLTQPREIEFDVQSPGISAGAVEVLPVFRRTTKKNGTYKTKFVEWQRSPWEGFPTTPEWKPSGGQDA